MMRTTRPPATDALPKPLRAAVAAFSLRGPLADHPQARVLHWVLVGLLLWSYCIYLPFILPFFVVARIATLGAIAGLTVVSGVSLALLRRGSLAAAGWVFLAALYLMDTASVVLFGGIRTPAMVHYISLPIMAAWLRGVRAAAGTAAACLAAALVIAILEVRGYHLPHYFPGTPIGIWGSLVTAMVASALPVAMILRMYDEALESQQSTLRLLDNIIRTSQDAILVKDRDGCTILSNPAATVHAGSSPQGPSNDETRALAGEIVRVTESLSAGAELRTFDTLKLPLRDSKGAISGVLSISRDVTTRLQLESQLHQAQKIESLGMLAGGVAHDFNNLLTVINGYADLLLAQLPSDTPLRHPIAEIRSAGQSAADLVKQLLVFSRKQVVRPRRLDLNTQISTQLDMLRRLLGADVEVTLELHGNSVVIADPGQFRQVLMNLIVNARDAMPSGGRVTIRTADVEVDQRHAGTVPGLTPGPFLLLAVADTGVGMPAEIQERIFDPFFTTKGTGAGTGLGLSTVYGIVRQGGGAIAVHSRPGQGAQFDLYFPRVDGPADAPSAVQQVDAPARASSGLETILVVEDQTEVRSFVVTLLSASGYRVLESADGEQALALAASFQEPIHLLLTDVVMPRMSGREVAERFLHTRPETKVLFMSGYAADAIADRGWLSAGQCFIAKPFTPVVLTAKVREVLSQRAE